MKTIKAHEGSVQETRTNKMSYLLACLTIIESATENDLMLLVFVQIPSSDGIQGSLVQVDSRLQITLERSLTTLINSCFNHSHECSRVGWPFTHFRQDTGGVRQACNAINTHKISTTNIPERIEAFP